jgi:hypothetical protein
LAFGAACDFIANRCLVWLIPIVLRFPSLIFPVPPLMVLIPATFALGVQIPPPVIRVAAVLAIFLDGSVEPSFRLFNCVLALRSIVGVCRLGGDKQKERAYHYCCRHWYSKSSLQDFLLSISKAATCCRLAILGRRHYRPAAAEALCPRAADLTKPRARFSIQCIPYLLQWNRRGRVDGAHSISSSAHTTYSLSTG